ncbi:MAG: SDR family NAD(P)-dependent oxidoreductase [Geminicoccaceae bacterium]
MPPHSGVVALTGATGFIGRRLVPALQASGYRVRALVRRQDKALAAADVAQVQGDLDDVDALKRLVAGTCGIIHAAGAVLAPNAARFESINVAGTRRVAAAAMDAGISRFVLVSSLAARTPALSPYASSKAAAEALVASLRPGLDVAIVRPPAVYGPGDRATLPMFRQLAHGFLVAPSSPEARFSLIFVDDLAQLMVGLLSFKEMPEAPIEPDDGRPGGYGWRDLATIAADSLQRRVRVLPLSRVLADAAATVIEAGSRVAGRSSLINRGKLAELFHPDWIARGGAIEGWRAWTTFADGFPATLEWYRSAGWIRG